MKAMFIRAHGDPSVMECGDLPDPEPAPGEVIVRVRASALNRLDLYTRAGARGTKVAPEQMPRVLGGDCAGEVAAVADDVTGIAVGERVVVNPLCGSNPPQMLGTHRQGSNAEFVAVPAANALPLPDALPFEQAAALPTVYLPTWGIIVREGRLQPDETALVLSSSSGVGTAAIQLIKGVVGASCIAVTSTGEKIRRSREIGADYAINYRTEDIAQRVKDLTKGRGVDLVVDSTGAAFFEAAYASLARGGRYGVCGVTAGYQAPLHLGQLFSKQLKLFGAFMGTNDELRQIVRAAGGRQDRHGGPSHAAACGRGRRARGDGTLRALRQVHPHRALMDRHRPLPPSPPAPERRGRWFYGWTIVAVISVVSFAGGVETNPVLGVFQGPMTDEFGWSRAIYTMPMSIGSFIGGVAALLVGPVMDRYGARWVMGAAIALMGLTFVLMGAVQELWHHFVLQIAGRTIVASTFFMVVGVVIPQWFIAMRGRATALANLGQRVGHVAFPVMVERILATGTWRTAWVAMGISVWAVSLLPALLLLRRRPEDHGMLPDGADLRDERAGPRGSAASVGPAPREVSFSRRTALRTPAFYLIAAAISIQSFVTTGIHFHWFSYLTGLGVSSGAAVVSLSLSPLISMPVSILGGLAAERVPIHRLIAASYFVMALSILLLLAADGALLAYAFGLAFGTSVGILFTVMNVVWADYFGRDAIGGIRGMVSPVHMLSNSLGPLIAAWSFDLTGSYQLIFAVQRRPQRMRRHPPAPRPQAPAGRLTATSPRATGRERGPPVANAGRPLRGGAAGERPTGAALAAHGNGLRRIERRRRPQRSRRLAHVPEQVLVRIARVRSEPLPHPLAQRRIPRVLRQPVPLVQHLQHPPVGGERLRLLQREQHHAIGDLLAHAVQAHQRLPRRGVVGLAQRRERERTGGDGLGGAGEIRRPEPAPQFAQPVLPGLGDPSGPGEPVADHPVEFQRRPERRRKQLDRPADPRDVRRRRQHERGERLPRRLPEDAHAGVCRDARAHVPVPPDAPLDRGEIVVEAEVGGDRPGHLARRGRRALDQHAAFDAPEPDEVAPEHAGPAPLGVDAPAKALTGGQRAGQVERPGDRQQVRCDHADSASQRPIAGADLRERAPDGRRRRYGTEEGAPVRLRRNPAVEHHDDAPVVPAADQAAEPLAEAEHGLRHRILGERPLVLAGARGERSARSAR